MKNTLTREIKSKDTVSLAELVLHQINMMNDKGYYPNSISRSERLGITTVTLRFTSHKG